MVQYGNYFLSKGEKNALTNALYIYAHHQRERIENMLDIVNAMYNANFDGGGWTTLDELTYDVLTYYREFLHEHPYQNENYQKEETENTYLLQKRMEIGELNPD